MPTGYCKVYNCDQFGKKDRKLVYHIPHFKTNGPLTPSQELRLKRRKAWLKCLGYKIDDFAQELDNIVVCSKHFVSGKPAPIKDVNNVDWIPTLHMGQDSDVVDLTLDSEDERGDDSSRDGVMNENPPWDRNEDTAVKERLLSNSTEVKTVTIGLVTKSGQVKFVKKELPRLKPSPQIAQALLNNCRINNGHLPGQDADVCIADCFVQTTTTESGESASTENFDEQNTTNLIIKLKTENQRLLSQNLTFKAKLLETEKRYKSLESNHEISMRKFSDLRYAVDKYTIDEKTFVADEDKTRYFTGLPTYDVLKAMFVHIEPYMDSTQCPITKFQQYILTLMRIRLNISFDLLGFVFRLPLHMVSKIFSRVLQVMYARYTPLVSWPDRENLFPSVPLLFRETFGPQIVVIVDTLELSVAIDTIEVLMDGPSASTIVTDYRNRTIVKFLIAISPQGAVNFISKGFGGKLTEKELIEASGLMQHLLPGDVILGEKGCSVHQIVEIKHNNVTRIQPYPFNYGQNISNLKIHVERIVDNIKTNFKCWSSGLPVEFFNICNDGPPTIDKMIQACCALNNASLTVVLE